MKAAEPAQPLDDVFVGRTRELDRLRTGLQQLAERRGQLFLIAGEIGTGKTRLAEAFADAATREGAQVEWGRCWEGTGAPAYWPWVQVIRSAVRHGGAELLASPGAADLAQVVPELRERIQSSVRTLPSEGDEGRFRFFDSIASFLRALAERQPLVLIFDDLHGADVSSLLLLRFVARVLRDAPLLLLGLYRDADVRRTPGLAELFGALAREGDAMALKDFTDTEVAELLERGLAMKEHVDDDLVAAITRTASGNPVFVTEIVRWIAQEQLRDPKKRIPRASFTVPDRVREAVAWRLGVARAAGPTAERGGADPPGAASPPVALAAAFEAGRSTAATPRRRAYELGQLLGQPRDLVEVLSIGTAHCREILGAEGVAVMLLDRARHELYFPYVAEAQPVVAQRLRQIRFPADRGLAGATLHQGFALRCDDVARDPRFFPGVDELTGRQTRNLLCAPLMGQTEALGVIEAVNAHAGAFSDDDLALLEAVARTLAGAIEHVRVHPEPEARPRNVFRKEGDYWLIAHEGREAVRLKDAKGFSYLAQLLRQPGQEIHAIDVMRAVGQHDGRAAHAPAAERTEGMRVTSSLGDAGEMLDAQARLAYRRRLDDVRAELEEAQACHDLGRIERAQHEIEVLTRELARAVGLGGRARRSGSAAERARVNVTRAITLALNRLDAVVPELRQHFACTVKTGTFCMYAPDPRAPIMWELE